MEQYKHLLEDAAKYSKGDLGLAMVSEKNVTFEECVGAPLSPFSHAPLNNRTKWRSTLEPRSPRLFPDTSPPKWMLACLLTRTAPSRRRERLSRCVRSCVTETEEDALTF